RPARPARLGLPHRRVATGERRDRCGLLVHTVSFLGGPAPRGLRVREVTGGAVVEALSQPRARAACAGHPAARGTSAAGAEKRGERGWPPAGLWPAGRAHGKRRGGAAST